MNRVIFALICMAVLIGCKSKAPENTVKEQTSDTQTAELQAKEETPKQEVAQPEAPKGTLPENAAQSESAAKEDVAKDGGSAEPEMDDDGEVFDEKAYDVPQDGTIEEKMASLKWDSGHVGRFDFGFEAPAFMKEMPAPANNDGSTFAWKDMKFLVWGAHDMVEGSAQKALDSSIEFLGHAPHYKLAKSNYYIISDYLEDGKIFYRKCIFKYDLEFCEELQYPKDYKKAVEPIVKKISEFDVTEEPELTF